MTDQHAPCPRSADDDTCITVSCPDYHFCPFTLDAYLCETCALCVERHACPFGLDADRCQDTVDLHWETWLDYLVTAREREADARTEPPNRTYLD